jgi:hypothetical protein
MRANFIYPHVKQAMTDLLTDRTDTYISYYINVKNFDVIFSDDFVCMFRWEILTTSQYAHKVAVRPISQIHWFDRPFLGANIMEN